MLDKLYVICVSVGGIVVFIFIRTCHSFVIFDPPMEGLLCFSVVYCFLSFSHLTRLVDLTKLNCQEKNGIGFFICFVAIPMIGRYNHTGGASSEDAVRRNLFLKAERQRSSFGHERLTRFAAPYPGREKSVEHCN